MNKYYVTFEAKYASEPHPDGGHPSGYFLIIADTEEDARRVMVERYNDKRCTLYYSKPEAVYYPLGLLKTIVAPSQPTPKLPTELPVSMSGSASPDLDIPPYAVPPEAQAPYPPFTRITNPALPRWLGLVITELDVLQQEVAQWERINFGENQSSDNQLLGVVEEVGELAHAVLKSRQHIRGSAADHAAKIDDAVGDILIYLMNFCSRTSRSMATCLAKAWVQVKDRDWLQGMPRCAVCALPIPVADMIRVGERGLVHMKCANRFMERIENKNQSNQQDK